MGKVHVFDHPLIQHKTAPYEKDQRQSCKGVQRTC